MKAIAWIIVAAALTWAPAGAQQGQQQPDQDEAMKPFPMEWRGAGASLVDLSGLLDKPAGAGGFVRVRDGHFVTPAGKRVRIWGVNLTGGACYPAKDAAAAYAERLASYGVNCVRLHFLDANWGKGTGIFPQGTDTTRQLDAALGETDK